MQDIKIPVLEEFYSIQGEGANTGKPAYFVRVGGCDLGCRWCDSKETWFPEEHQWIPISEVVERILHTPARTVVVTGGEPMIYNFDSFCYEMHINNINTMIETCGAHSFSGEWDWVCLSPKRQKAPIDLAYKLANELKIIIFEDEDYNWAELCATKVDKNCKLYFQPEWSRFKINRHKVVEYAKLNPQWNISLQIHKFLEIP
ncbi:MAG: 7-carboxy-7-deazaguanine synthase QueE [Bacteroidales bacterium]|nr:7-carboxy-7-deazaguanine synthase QueE [Bacteroidales bacterium]